MASSRRCHFIRWVVRPRYSAVRSAYSSPRVSCVGIYIYIMFFDNFQLHFYFYFSPNLSNQRRFCVAVSGLGSFHLQKLTIISSNYLRTFCWENEARNMCFCSCDTVMNVFRNLLNVKCCGNLAISKSLSRLNFFFSSFHSAFFHGIPCFLQFFVLSIKQRSRSSKH